MVNMSRYLFSYIIQFILNISFRTSTINIHGKKYLDGAVKSNSPLLLCVWHGRLIYDIYFFKKKQYNLWALISTHRDAEVLANIMKRWKFNLVRGSSTRGWKHAIVEIQKKLKDPTSIVAVTCDGPKGPAKIAKPGSIKLALKNNAQIITMSSTCSKFFEFNSWDNFRIPKPFSKIDIHFSPLLDIDENKLETMGDSEYLTEFISEFEQKIDKEYANG